MNAIPKIDMFEATRLTREGRLDEAMAVLRGALSGAAPTASRSEPQRPAPQQAPDGGAARFIDMMPPSPGSEDFHVTVNDWYNRETTEMYANNSKLCMNGAVGASTKTPGRGQGCAADGTDILPESFVSALFGGRGRYNEQ